MFLNKTALVTTLAIFITGCVSINNEAQQAQINDLQGELIQAQKINQQTQLLNLQTQKINQQTQTELTSTNNILKTCQNNVEKLTKQLKKSKQVKKSLAAKNSTKFDDKTILGQTEWVYLSTVKSNYKARIDTGATTSSLNAVNIERFERDGKKWVRFNLEHEQGLDPQMIEAKIERFVKIIQSSKPGETTERPVIKLHIRIGDVSHQTEFTLADRSHMEYPVLIGRTFMQDVVLVDVSKEYIHPKYQVKQ